MTALLIATRNTHKAREIQQVLAADFQYLTLNDFPDAPGVVEDGATFAANAAKKVTALAAWLETSIGRARLRRAVEIPSPLAVGRGPGIAAPSILHPPSSMLAFYILADDSGLEVDALDGAPGVYSARFAARATRGAGNSPDRANNAKLLRLLKNVPPEKRTARFRCVLALRRLLLPAAAETVPYETVSALNPNLNLNPNPNLFAEPLLFEGVCPGRISLQPSGGGGFGYDPLFIPDGCARSFAELGDAVKNTLSHRALALQKLRRYFLKNAG
jgi:XTP/dITP diphosphohydrolase